jgi:hypothetical protein
VSTINLFFTVAAQENIDSCKALVPSLVDDDVDAIRDGTATPEQFLTYCLDGEDSDRRQGWLDYVNEICRAVYAADGRTFEPLSLPAGES